MWKSTVILFNLVLSFAIFCAAKNKYSEDANKHFKSQFIEEPNVNIRSLNKPFRMAKLNLLWTKAQVRLTEPKLKSLFSDLKIQDKEELTWKRLKAEGMDKEGLKEADLRKKLTGIMSTYGLLEHFEDVNDTQKYKHYDSPGGKVDPSYINKSLFKDKKLNKLWARAETSGFTAEELQILKEEFHHHQEKVDQYFSLLNEVEEGDKDAELENTVDDKHDKFNVIDILEENEIPKKDYFAKVNHLRDKHRDIRDDYDRLYRKTVSGPNNQEFIEPKVQGLWKLATNGNFTPEELESLKAELFHYEKRLLKLRNMQVDAAFLAEKGKGKDKGNDLTEDMIKKQTRKVVKLHEELESRIKGRQHAEL